VTVLLTTSAAPQRSPFNTAEKRRPLGLGFLCSVLRQAGHRVIFRDPYLRYDPRFPSAEFLRDNAVGFVGIYSNTICLRDTLRMCSLLQRYRREGLWQGTIAVGGPHASVAPQTLLGAADYVAVGEGEPLIVHLVEGRLPRGVVRARPLEDLDSLPRPAYDIFSGLGYDDSHPALPVRPVYTLNTSRGCPYGCTFCSVGSVWGRSYRCMSAERVVDDVEWLMRDFGARGIYFREDHFTLSRSRTREFCELVLRRRLRFLWACESRADSLDRDLLRLMRRAGCRSLYIGVESGSPRVLKNLKKGETLSDFRRVFRECRRIGIRTYASFIVGTPGERARDVLSTLLFARRLADSRSFNVFVGIPYSQLYRDARRKRAVGFIDASGLEYMKGHNRRVLAVYGPSGRTKTVPGAQDSLGVRLLVWLLGTAERVPLVGRRIAWLMRKALLLW